MNYIEESGIKGAKGQVKDKVDGLEYSGSNKDKNKKVWAEHMKSMSYH